MSKYGHRPVDWFEAIVNKLGGEESAEEFLRDQYLVSKPSDSWFTEKGVVYFGVTSDNTTGKQWMGDRFNAGMMFCPYTPEILKSGHFVPTNGVTYLVAILTKGIFPKGQYSFTAAEIDAEARKHGLTKATLEVACLVRDKIDSLKTLKLMGVDGGITFMHKPVDYRDRDGTKTRRLMQITAGQGDWLELKTRDVSNDVFHLGYDGYAYIAKKIPS